jgi:hypothetical protein
MTPYSVTIAIVSWLKAMSDDEFGDIEFIVFGIFIRTIWLTWMCRYVLGNLS